jgi:hypothetical protein
MRITAAGIRSGFPITRFAAPAATRREPHLGLRRRLAPQISSRPAQHARVPLLDALHAATRGTSASVRAHAEQLASQPRRVAVLRRADSMTWSRTADSNAHRPRSRSAAPWRG